MSDDSVRDLERRFRLSGSSEDNLVWRDALKKSGGDAVFDLSLPHSWGVVEAAEVYSNDYGSVKKLLSDVCYGDSGLHPFVGGVSRPLSFKETIQARMDQLQVTGKFGSLWASELDTSSAIVYKANSSKFKVVMPFSAHLLGLRVNFKDLFVSVRYDEIVGRGVVELDAKNGVYNEHLTMDQVIVHPGWLAALGGNTVENRALLAKYAEVVFGRSKRDCMGFWLVTSPKQDQLRALRANSSEGQYVCYGNNLCFHFRFARVCPPPSKE